jgi:hypothetical protein
MVLLEPLVYANACSTAQEERVQGVVETGSVPCATAASNPVTWRAPREGREIMTTKSDFTEDEWIRVRRAPFVAGMAISIADPGGPIEVVKETTASLRAVSTPPSEEELLVAVSKDIRTAVEHKENPLAGFKPSGAALAGKEVLEELRAVNEIVTAKATPDEAQAFRQWLVATAQAAADAAKEGGFMGFGAEQVSKGEQAMLEQLRSTLGSG